MGKSLVPSLPLFDTYTRKHRQYLSLLHPFYTHPLTHLSSINIITSQQDRLGPEHEISGPDDFTRLTFEVIGLTTMNYRFNCFYADEMPKFCVAMADALVEAGKITNRMALENTLRVFSHRKFQDDVNYMKSVADHIIADRKKNPRPDLHDLLNTMLNGKDPKSGEQM